MPAQAGSRSQNDGFPISNETPRLIAMPEVSKRVGLAKSTIYQWIAASKFPPPVQLGSTSRWVEAEISAWISEQIAARDGQDRAA